MDRQEFWEDRMKFVNNVMKELFATACSHKLTVGRKKVEAVEKESFRGLDGSVIPYDKEPQRNRKGKTPLYSECYRVLSEKIVVSPEKSSLDRYSINALTDQDIWNVWKKGDASLRALTDPNFQFDEGSLMSDEVHFIAELYKAAGPEGDPEIDFAMMKVLFHAGKMIERQREEGRKTSDGQSKSGSKHSKNHVGVQAVFDAFYRVNLEGLKKMTPISVEIEKYLQAAEKSKPKNKQKKVYSDRYIRSILIKDRKIRGTLIAEGILKK